MQRIPTLVGTRGHFKDAIFVLQYGKPLTVGRSRKADFSLKRTNAYRAQTPQQRENDTSAHTVSAVHFQITMFNLRSIEIKNLSPNGTQVDGRPVESLLVDDVSSATHEIRFGQDEAVRLELRMHEDAG